MTHASQTALRYSVSRNALRPLARALAACSMLTLWPFAPDAQAQALPGGLRVASGQAQLGINGQTMTVTNSANAILNWQSFSIGANNIVHFQQPNAASQVLNRVTGRDPSTILGQLNSNGKVWLINPNGVLFGRNARVDVAGLVASTLDVDDSRWSSGQYAFSAATGVADANVTNLGELHSSLGGRIALLGGNVSNQGLIEAPGGQVLLAAGRSMDLVDTGTPNLTLRVAAPQGEALNLGSLSAPGGRIDIQAAVVNQQGVVRADALDRGPGGTVVLRATSALTLAAGSTTTANGNAGGGSVTLDAGSGTALVSGNVAATAPAGTGGTIELLGHQVGALDGASLDASGALGGGSIFMGGGARGQDATIANAQAAYVGPQASLRADATQRGNGGNIVLWSDDATRAYGSFSARGGNGGGNGGSIETSGGWLDARPASVDASAPAGGAGRWLLDPNNLTIVNGDANTNIDTRTPDFTTTDDTAVLGTLLIEQALNGGQNVTVTTSSRGANTESGDITMANASIYVAPPSDVSLTINASRNITLTNSTISAQPQVVINSRPSDNGAHPASLGNGALSVSLLAAGGGVGAIAVQNSSIVTNGGNIVLGGSGQAVGTDTAPFLGAVGYTATGDLTHGTGVGVYISTLNAGAGGITMNGATATNSIAGASGVEVNESTLSGGDIAVTGWANGPATQTGVRVFNANLTATHAIDITGTARSTWDPASAGTIAGVYVGTSYVLVQPTGADATSRLVIQGDTSISGTPIDADTHSKIGVHIDEGGGQSLRETGGGVLEISGTVSGAPAGYSVVVAGLSGDSPTDVLDASGARLLGIAGNGPSMNFAAAGMAVPDGGELNISNSGAITISNALPFGSAGALGASAIHGGAARATIAAGTDLTFTASSIDLTAGSGDAVTLRAGGNGPYGTLTLDNASITATLPIHLQGNTVVLSDSTQVHSYANGDSIVVSGPNGDNVSLFHDDPDSLFTPTYGGRWLVYATDPSAEHFQAGALDEDFRQYNTASAGSQVASGGNGFLFSLAPTVTFAGNPTKVYDGDATIGLSSANLTLNGAVGSDQVYLNEAAFGTFADKNAGVGKGIALDGDALFIATADGKPIYGYGIGSISGSISPKPITFGVVTAANKVYDGNTSAAVSASPGISGLVGNETLVVTPTGTFDSRNVGTGKLVTVDFNVADGDGGLASNYSWSPVATTHADITPKLITFGDLTAANKVYDGNTVATITPSPVDVNGLVPGETLGVTPTGTFDTKNVGANKLVTIDFNVANGSGLATNYTWSSVATTHADITPKPITFGDPTAANKVYDGNTAATVSSPIGISGLVGDELLAVTATGTFDTKNAGTGKLVNVDFNVANGDGGLASNYSWSPVATTHADITPKLVTFGDLTAANKVYDGNTVATITPSPVDVNGLVPGETLGVTPSGTFDTKNAGVNKLVTIDFNVANGSGLATNYTWSSVATTHADITPKPITFGDPTAANKVYDGNTAATVSSPIGISGLVGDELLAVTATGTFDTKNAGTGKLVNIDFNVANGDGGLASNYSWSPVATTHADITPKLITFGDLTAANKVYDGNTVATITPSPVDVNGLVPGETLGVTPTGTFDTKNAGVNKLVTIDFNVANGSGGGLASNYTWSSVATTHADITPKAITFGDVTAANKVYDGNTSATVSNSPGISGLVGDELLAVTATGSFDTKNTGTGKLVTVDFNVANGDGGLASNYSWSSVATTRADITPKTITFSDVTASNKVYDGNTVATITPSPVGVNGLVGGETLAVTPSGTFDTKNAATNKVVTVDFSVANGSGGGLASNYTWSSVATTHADITPKAITFGDVTAANKVYDGNTAATVSTSPVAISGLVNDETLAVTPTGTFDAKDAGTGKRVSIDFNVANGSNGGLASNYSWSSVATTHADITPKPITFGDVVAANKVYDGNTAATVSTSPVGIIGLVGDETLVVTPTGTFDTKNAGTGKLVNVDFNVANGSNGGLGSNYSWSAATTTHADITPKPISIGSLAAADKTYDGTRDATVVGVTLDGLVGSETLGIASSGSFDTRDAGTGKLVTVNLALSNGSNGGLASNYAIASTTGTTSASIQPKAISVDTLSAADKTYDGTTAATVTGWSLQGIVAGDQVQVAAGSGAFTTAGAGVGKVVTGTATALGGADAGNYVFGSNTGSGNADIAPATLTYAAGAVTGIAGAPVRPLTGQLTGFVAGQTQADATTGTVNWSSPATSGSGAGNYAVVGGGLSAANYVFVQSPDNTAALTLTPLPAAATSIGSVNTSLGSSLQAVQVATIVSTPSQGRVLDVTAALQTGTTDSAAFSSLPLAQMSRESVAAMLAARDAYKRDLFANAIAQLQKDPGAADLPACTTTGQVDTGECLITTAQRDNARTEYLARANIDLDALPPTAAGPTLGAPRAASSTPSEPDPVAVLEAAASPAPLIEKRQIHNAALPQIERKLAVVIGVDRFDDKRIPELKNAVSDAKSVAAMLESSLGYETIIVENATRKSVIRTLNRVAAEVGPSDSVIVYYAGHGELVPSTGLGYWQLSDADADRPETWLSNVDIGKLLAQLGASQVALVSDSCYSGSLVSEQIRASADKLDPSKVLAGRAVVVMSSGGNEPVFDSGKDGHSTFASSLMQRLQQVSTWQAGGNVFERVRYDVARQLPQHPQYGASIAAGHQEGTDYLFEQRQLDAAKQ